MAVEVWELLPKEVWEAVMNLKVVKARRERLEEECGGDGEVADVVEELRFPGGKLKMKPGRSEGEVWKLTAKGQQS